MTGYSLSVGRNCTHGGEGWLRSVLFWTTWCGTTGRMTNRRIVSSALLVAVSASVIVVGVVNAGRDDPAPRIEAPLTQPDPASLTMEDILDQAKRIGPPLEQQPLPPVSMPLGWACPGTEHIQNIHVRVGPAPDHFAQGKAMGMSDDRARAYAVEVQAGQQAMDEQLRKTLATLPPPPCP